MAAVVPDSSSDSIFGKENGVHPLKQLDAGALFVLKSKGL